MGCFTQFYLQRSVLYIFLRISYGNNLHNFYKHTFLRTLPIFRCSVTSTFKGCTQIICLAYSHHNNRRYKMHIYTRLQTGVSLVNPKHGPAHKSLNIQNKTKLFSIRYMQLQPCKADSGVKSILHTKIV